MTRKHSRKGLLAMASVTMLLSLSALSSTATAASRPVVQWPYQTTPWTYNPNTWVTQKLNFNRQIIKLLPLSDSIPRIAKKLPALVNIAPNFSTDLRTWAEPVGNQGGVGSCVSWAIGYGMAGWWANKKGKMASSDWFNPMSVYSLTRGTPEPPGGSYPADAMTRVRDVGVTKAADYSVDEFNYSHVPTTSEVNAGRPFKFTSFRTLFNDTPAGTAGISMIKAELLAGRPVQVSMKVFSDFMDTSRVNNSNTYTPSSTASFQGRHAVLALGYNINGLLIQNSWGTGWGSNGYKRLSWSFVKDNVYRAYVADGMVS